MGLDSLCEMSVRLWSVTRCIASRRQTSSVRVRLRLIRTEIGVLHLEQMDSSLASIGRCNRSRLHFGDDFSAQPSPPFQQHSYLPDLHKSWYRFLRHPTTTVVEASGNVGIRRQETDSASCLLQRKALAGRAQSAGSTSCNHLRSARHTRI
jgi:hypothetical protein